MCCFSFIDFKFLYQLSKKKIWRSRSLNSDQAHLFSIVLDDELPHWKLQKYKMFTYHFVRHNSPLNEKIFDDDSLSATSSATKDLNFTLRNRDYVVWSILLRTYNWVCMYFLLKCLTWEIYESSSAPLVFQNHTLFSIFVLWVSFCCLWNLVLFPTYLMCMYSYC